MLIMLGAMFVFIISMLIFIAKANHKIPQGKAILRYGVGGVKIAYEGGMIAIPFLHTVEYINISMHLIHIEFLYSKVNSLLTKDNQQVDLKASFQVRISKDLESILEAAQKYGCTRASDSDFVNSLFAPKFEEALKVAVRQRDFQELYSEREKLKTAVLQFIGVDLNGFVLSDFAIHHLERAN